MEIEEQKEKNWLEEEMETPTNEFDGEKLPGMSFEENKITTITVDISKPWGSWTDYQNNGALKKKIPVLHDGERKLWWLNTRNPIYSELKEMGVKAFEDKKDSFEVKILRTGQKQNTRYAILKD